MSIARPKPQAIVVFGASGDLTRRKVMPAFYNLFTLGLMPETFAILGYARTPLGADDFRDSIRDAIKEHGRLGFNAALWKEFASRLGYVSGEYGDPGGISELFPAFRELDEGLGDKDEALFYCATPPSAFPQIIEGLGSLGLADRGRIVIEKPFGRDIASARELNELLHRYFDEQRIFRIDHYLGKENVQNILVFRFSNGMFEPIWNRRYISSVQIEVAEDLGIGSRGKFYEESGAVRDILQNHILQLLAILAMEPPASFDASAIRDEKAKVLKAVAPIEPAKVIKAQYTGAHVGEAEVPSYRQEPNVDPDSLTETFIAARLKVQNWRWAGVPFFIRTGKRMPKRATTITITFHDAPHMMFGDLGVDCPANHLTIRVQPDEGITITFDAKVPGPEMRLQAVDMSFDYDRSFEQEPPEAYEYLLQDAMQGDPTLFIRSDEVEQSWRIVSPLLAKTEPLFYPAGTWGPEEADRLVAPGRWGLKQEGSGSG